MENSDKVDETSFPQTTDDIRKTKTTIVDELEYISDENEKFWRTPSSARMVRGGTLMVTFDIIGSLFFAVYMMTISRAPTSDAALLAIIDTLGLMLKFFSYLGFSGAGSKFLSEYLVRDKETARIYAKESAKYNMWITGFPLIAIALYMYLSQPADSVEQLAYLTLLITIIFDRMTSCVAIYLLGYQRYDLYTWAYYVPFGFQYILAIITYQFMGVSGPLISFAFVHVVMFFLSLWMMKKCSDFPLSDLIDWRKDYGLFKKLFSFNFLYSLANLAFALLTSTLLISGGEFLGILTSQEIVALYTVSTFSNILINLFGVVGSIMVGISEASALKNKKLVENYLMLAVKFPLLMTIAVLTFFFLFGAEMVEIFYGSRWITMGMLIMVCLMPSYTTSAFGSKYDNILAGIGRPEVVVKPWMIALFIGVAGLFLTMLIPANTYIVDNWITYKGETLNYGISYRFAFALILISIALFIGGIWVVKVCLRVLGVKIPGYYIWRPILVAGITAFFVKLILLILPLRALVDPIAGEVVGGIIFTIIMVLVGVSIFLVLGLLFDVMNIEDGQFWKMVIDGFGPFKVLFKPIFAICKWLLHHQIRYFVRPPIKWVLSTDKEVLAADSQFHITVLPLTKGITRSVKGVQVNAGQILEFQVTVSDLRLNLYDAISYARIDFDKIAASLMYNPKISQGLTEEFYMKFALPQNLRVGTHELVINFEVYEVPRPEISPEQLFNKGRWAYNDFRLRWTHEERYFVYISSDK